MPTSRWTPVGRAWAFLRGGDVLVVVAVRDGRDGPRSRPGRALARRAARRRAVLRRHERLAAVLASTAWRCSSGSRRGPGRVRREGTRVLLISWEYPPVIEGGLARHVRKLAEHLVGRRPRGPRADPRRRASARRGGAPRRHRAPRAEPPYPGCRRLRALGRRDERRHVALALELCERLDFELVHSHDWLVAGAAERLARARGLPWLITIHATEFGRHQGWVDKHPSPTFTAPSARWPAAPTASSPARDTCAATWPACSACRRAVTAIPNGVDPADLRTGRSPTSPACGRSTRTRADRLVLLVGRLVYEKGFHLALDALAPWYGGSETCASWSPAPAPPRPS